MTIRVNFYFDHLDAVGRDWEAANPGKSAKHDMSPTDFWADGREAEVRSHPLPHSPKSQK